MRGLTLGSQTLPATLDTLGIVVPPVEIPAPKGGLQNDPD
jgi:hypothetical protein